VVLRSDVLHRSTFLHGGCRARPIRPQEALARDDPTRWGEARDVRGGASPAGKPRGAFGDAIHERQGAGRYGHHRLCHARRPTPSVPLARTRPDTGKETAPLDGIQPSKHRRPPRLRRPPRGHLVARRLQALALEAVQHEGQSDGVRPVVARRQAAAREDRHRRRAVTTPISTDPERVNPRGPSGLEGPAYLPSTQTMAHEPHRLPEDTGGLFAPRAAGRPRHVHRRGPVRPRLDANERMNDDRWAPLLLHGLVGALTGGGRPIHTSRHPFLLGRHHADAPPPTTRLTPPTTPRTNPRP
jgi:hypothetical protein